MRTTWLCLDSTWAWLFFLVGAGAGEPDFTVGCSDDDSSLRACSVDGRLSPLVLQNSSSMCVFVRGGSFVGAEHW